MRFFKRPQYRFSRTTSNIIISLGVAAAVVLILWQAGLAVIFNNFPVDRSGNVAPVTVFGGTGGVFTGVSSVDPLPVTLGAPTASTDPLGWGQAFFPSNVKGGQAGDCTIESSLNIVCKEPTASVNALNSTDGGRIYKQLSTGLLAGNIHTTAHTVGGGVIFMTGFITPPTNFRRSVNSGATWVVAATPPPTTGTATIQACRSTATASLCVGSDALNSSIWRSVDQGNTWARVHDVIATGIPTGQNFCGIENTTGTTWIALICNWVGGLGSSEGDIYRSTDDGATWSLFSTTLGAAGYGANGAGLTKVLTLGAARQMLALAGNTIYLSTDDGATWTPNFTKSSSTLFIKAVDMGTGIWVAFAALPASAGREVWRSTNDGFTWSLAYSDGEATSSARTPPDYSFKGDSSSGIMVMNTNTGSNATAFWYSRPVQSGEVRPTKAFTLFAKQTTCAVSPASLVSAAFSGKRDVVITNRGDEAIFIGGLGTLAFNGHRLAVGESIVFDLFEGDVFCAALSSTQNVHVTEVRD